MKNKFAVAIISFSCHFGFAQSFSNSYKDLYDNFNTFFIQEIPIEVEGLPSTSNDKYGLEKVILTLHHPRVSDLKIQLQSPDGTTVWVTNRNGGLTGQNYISTEFSQFGKNGLINNATAPFIGNYTPSGEFSFFNNGKNPNGIWKLLVEDLMPGEKGLLDSVILVFGANPAFISHKKTCSFQNPESCQVSKKSNGVLLPDLVIVPSFSKYQFHEFSSNDSLFPGQLKVAVAIANIGNGPLEVSPNINVQSDCCSGDTVVFKGNERYDLYQKVYSLSNEVFSHTSTKTGTIYFESMPGHNHFHVDDWIEMRLVKMIKGKRYIVCKGAKVSYCLFTTGMLYEKDSSSNINGIQYGTNLPNYGLGEYYACSLNKQGITVGGYDYYGMLYEGQFLQLPAGFKNGNYILEIEIDPERKYIESNRQNNVFSMPISISKQ